MINDNEMLNYVLQNAEMGCNGISAVRKQLKDNKVDGVLCEQLINIASYTIVQIQCLKGEVRMYTMSVR